MARSFLMPAALRKGTLRGQFGDFGETQVTLGEGLGQDLLDFALFAVTGNSQLAHEQIASPFQHLFSRKESDLP